MTVGPKKSKRSFRYRVPGADDGVAKQRKLLVGAAGI